MNCYTVIARFALHITAYSIQLCGPGFDAELQLDVTTARRAVRCERRVASPLVPSALAIQGKTGPTLCIADILSDTTYVPIHEANRSAPSPAS